MGRSGTCPTSWQAEAPAPHVAVEGVREGQVGDLPYFGQAVRIYEGVSEWAGREPAPLAGRRKRLPHMFRSRGLGKDRSGTCPTSDKAVRMCGGVSEWAGREPAPMRYFSSVIRPGRLHWACMVLGPQPNSASITLPISSCDFPARTRLVARVRSFATLSR
jgi:hypothetical protein